MIDRVEQARRGQSPPKTSTKHLYAAIEHRVIDSPAYADLSFSARSLLLQIARQTTKNNNGHLQATYSYLQKFGFSERTVIRGVKELIAHGFIYRTRCGGYQQGASKFALTWLPITNRQDIYLDGFQACAWRKWDADQKKIPLPNLPSITCQIGTLTPATHAKKTGSPGAKFTDNELIPHRGIELAPTWIPEYVARLTALGLAHACPVAIH